MVTYKTNTIEIVFVKYADRLSMHVVLTCLPRRSAELVLLHSLWVIPPQLPAFRQSCNLCHYITIFL